MCFSAQASFTAAAVLITIGTLTVYKLPDRRALLLACMPFLFAVQQLAEGVLWLGPSMGALAPIAKHTFLIIAFTVWPLYIPLALSMIEKNPTRKTLILMCEVAGVMWTFFMAYHLSQGSITMVKDCHIYYQISSYPLDSYLTALYFVATVAPLFIASEIAFKILGIAGAVSAIITYVTWYSYYTSIWCFFAAILSLAFYFIINHRLYTKKPSHR